MQIWGFSKLQWYASKSCHFVTNQWARVSYSHPSTQFRLHWLYCQIGWVHMQCWICHNDMPSISRCTRISIVGQQKQRLWHEYVSLCLIFWHMRSKLPRLSLLPLGWGNMQWSIGCMDMYSSLSGAPEHRSITSKSCGFAMNKWAMSHILTQVLILARSVWAPNVIGKNATLDLS